MKKYITIAISAIALSLAVSGCKGWLDINTNPNYPTNVDKSSLLPTVQMRTAEKVGYELTLVGSFWSQYIVQCSQTNQYYVIQTNNLTNSSSYFTSPWSVFYAQNLPSLKEMLQAYEGKEGYENFEVEAKTMLAYHLYLLTSLYDNVCYTESFKTDNYRTTSGDFNPKFDTGEETQANLIALLEEIRGIDSAALADAEEAHSSASVDMVFGGDTDNWIKFANTLYLKVLLRDFAANQTKISDLLAENNFLDTDDASFDNYEDKPDKSNPLYESDRRQLNTTYNIRTCNSALYELSGSDDRLEKFYTPVPGYSSYAGANYSTRGSRTSTGQLKLAATDPVYFSTVDEAEFLKAEAYARLGNDTEPQTAYENAVKAAFARVGASNAEACLAGDYAFATGSTEDMLNCIITQKWLSNIKGMPIESWFDINRTGYPERGAGKVLAAYSGYLASGTYPCRFMYSRTSYLYNENSPEPVALNVPMWWHKN